MADISSQMHPSNPASKPPLKRRTNRPKDHHPKISGKKQSLPCPTFPKDDSLLGGNLLEKPNVERSLSWGNLTQLSLADPQRSLSASNLYALNNPDLSIKAAISKKAYDKPNTSFSKEKAIFTAWTQKYYYQLTVGCGNELCRNLFCKSSSNRKKLDQKMIPLISIELAGYKNHHLCVKDKKRQAARVLEPDLFKIELDDKSLDYPNHLPFLYRFYSMSPFRSLFLPCPLTPSGLGLHKTHSQGELNTPLKTNHRKDHNSPEHDGLANSFKSHLTSLTNSISNSLNNIFLYASQSDLDESDQTSEQKQYRKSLESKDETKAWEKDEKDKSMMSPLRGEQFLTRTRIPSVRIFGDENAVALDSMDANIDEFETSVTAELCEGYGGLGEGYDGLGSGDTASNIDDTTDAFFSDDVYGGDDNGDDEEEMSDGYSLTHLTLDMFQKIVQNYQECGDEMFLLNTIRTVFASWDSLMMSFQHEGMPNGKKFPFDVKIIDVVETFSLLKEADQNEKFLIILADTLQVMLLKKQAINESKELKPLVIILAIPYLFKYVQVVHEISSIINDLSPNSLTVLSQFIFQCFSSTQFKYLIDGLKWMIQTECTRSSSILQNNQRVVCLCKTIQLLYLANNVQGDHRTILSNASFYCEELTTKVDFKQVYAYWKRRNFSTTNSILNYAFLLEPAVKVNVIHIDAITQMREEYQDAIVHQARMNQVQKSWSDFNDSSKISLEVRSAMCPYLLLEIRRANLINDTLKQLQEKSSDLKKPLKIKYTAGGEQGLDMGGLQKEFFQVIVETVFNTSYGLFNIAEDGNVVWFNAYSFESTVMFELVGILLGLAIYNGIILDVHFPLLVYKKLLAHKVVLQDLRDIQPTLASGLQQLLDYPDDVGTDFCQTFQISHSVYGKPTSVELLPGGNDMLVTNENRMQFVNLYVDNILNKSIEKQFDAFSKGFYQVCNGPTIKLFTPPELELLVCGNPDLDFKALEKVTEYRDGYNSEHSLMKSFWKIVHGFTFKQKQALLMFVTGSYRVPLKGLAAMSFYIQRNGPDSHNLPTSMTCFNRLLLPEYCSSEKLDSMLLLAIENSKGFGLT